MQIIIHSFVISYRRITFSADYKRNYRLRSLDITSLNQPTKIIIKAVLLTNKIKSTNKTIQK